MDRRPSIISVSSLGSISGLLKPAQLPALPESSSQAIAQNGASVIASRKLSLNGKIEHSISNGDFGDPDELFTKHTVAEVKVIQQRLRSDADAKQEELRVMVGERYRDLLQASTSIISIAESSKRVVTTLNDMRLVSSSVESAHSPKASLSGQDDSHLHTLQSLAAHMKLLLDAPEHLWRLLERKSYLNAAWLFLLSRVVHRSLLREQDDEDVAWSTSGINISDQFPLVQRQWDAVSQFRAQITHKATLSLRESPATSVEVCATLLTLHLLESRPLPETLATLLAQRSRTLTAALSDRDDGIPNGNASSTSKAVLEPVAPRSRKIIIREVRRRLKTVLEILSRTLDTARTIFNGMSGESQSLMQAVLQHIQTDNSQATAALPTELRLTSASLLSTLPSSNHFLLLPNNVRLYKPYVDASPLYSEDTMKLLLRKLDEWFQKSIRQVQQTLEVWFADLDCVREIWKIRTWASTWIHNTETLRPEEKKVLSDSLDTICQQRATSVWNVALTGVATIFHAKLQTSLEQLASSHYDTQPVTYLFRAPPMPQIQATNLPAANASFQKFKATLQQQIVYRTPLLDDTLSATESGVQTLHDDMQAVYEDESSSSLPSRLTSQYREDAGLLCRSIASALQDSLESIDDTTEFSMQRVAFVGRIARGISASPVIAARLSCHSNIMTDFCTTLATIAALAESRWQDFVLTQALRKYWSSVNIISCIGDSAPRPSSALIECLIYLESSVQQASTSIDVSSQGKEVFARLVKEFLSTLDKHITPEVEITHLLWDMAFLLRISVSWEPDIPDTTSLLRNKMEDITKPEQSPLDTDMAEYLSRLQHLLGVLLPPSSHRRSSDKASNLLLFGPPSSDASHTPTLSLMKPSARFGLLLVGSSYTR